MLFVFEKQNKVFVFVCTFTIKILLELPLLSALSKTHPSKEDNSDEDRDAHDHYDIPSRVKPVTIPITIVAAVVVAVAVGSPSESRCGSGYGCGGRLRGGAGDWNNVW
jgi:hypothetical protein